MVRCVYLYSLLWLTAGGMFEARASHRVDRGAAGEGHHVHPLPGDQAYKHRSRQVRRIFSVLGVETVKCFSNCLASSTFSLYMKMFS